VTRAAAEWNDFFVANNIAASSMLRREELLDHPHFAGREMLAKSDGGEQQLIADAVRWMDDGNRPGHGFRPVGEPGADTEAAMREWLGAGVAAR
jgi:crotonobetainyl-CoA:carnitine CoA-transferase CaiB-like acyl-CoA transferase